MLFSFIPNKVILFDDKGPPWMDDEIKTMIKREKKDYFKVKESLVTLTLLF